MANCDLRVSFYSAPIPKELIDEVSALMPEDLKLLEWKDGDYQSKCDMLKKLLDWFKDSFFTWIDEPACRKCGNTSNIV